MSSRVALKNIPGLSPSGRYIAIIFHAYLVVICIGILYRKHNEYPLIIPGRLDLYRKQHISFNYPGKMAEQFYK